MSGGASIEKLLANVPGFGDCGRCPYRESGSSLLCFTCARRSMQGLAPVEDRCQVCDQSYEPPSRTCGNPICSRRDRQFEWSYAVAMRTGPLEHAIHRYKFDAMTGWKLVFGRILLGFLEANRHLFTGFDIITAAPTYTGPGGRSFDHTREILRAADAELPGRWPFDLDDPALVQKVALTEKFSEQKSRTARQALAVGPYRESLRVPRPELAAGKHILVYDDIFTTGHVTNEIARALLIAGAESVCGVTLGRQPWGQAAR